MLGTDAAVSVLTVIDLLAILLSIVALAVTTIGFFASLRFYRDGVELQTTVRDLLTKVAEKTDSIKTQVDEMFGKTLDAAISKGLPGVEITTPLPSVDGAEQPADIDGDIQFLANTYMSLEGLKLSDVSAGTARTLYSIGSPFGFLLLDAPGRIVFWGSFWNLQTRDIALRARLLLANFAAALARVEEVPEGSTKESVLALLRKVGITLIVANDTPADVLASKIAERQTEGHVIDVKVLTPSALGEVVDREYDKLGL